jgi:hypothetical protein
VMWKLLAVAFVLGALGGCDAPESAPRQSAANEPLALDIPRVAKPLDVTRFAADPCALLTSSERAEIGLPDTSYDAEINPERCDLQADADHPDPVNYQRIVVSPDSGLDDAYAQCRIVDSIDCTRWSVGAIDGYPVLRANGGSEHKYGFCRLFLGVSDHARVAIIDVRVDLDADGPNCERAERSAGRILATLR